jgi:hypothetical protein
MIGGIMGWESSDSDLQMCNVDLQMCNVDLQMCKVGRKGESKQGSSAWVKEWRCMSILWIVLGNDMGVEEGPASPWLGRG